MIPTILQNENLKFCRIKKGTKKPFEMDWTNKLYSWKEIESFVEANDENYGVLCGHGDLAVIDSDNTSFQIAIENMFPETFRVQTGSGGTHNYFFIKNFKQKIILYLDDDDKTHLGEVQSYGTQVVGPGSIHPNGNTYKVLNNSPITEIDVTDLYENLKPFMKKEIKQVEDSARLEYENNQGSNEIDQIAVTSILGTSGLKRHKNGDYYGSHPIHGSTGGINFRINPMKNVWYCFRDNSGGGVLSAIAIKEGLIDCSQAHKGAIRGDLARRCIDIAKEKYGLTQTSNDFKPTLLTKPQTNFEVEKIEEIKIIFDRELKDLVIQEKDWIVEKLIPTKSICILTGKRGTMKTFISLNLAYCVALGENFLEKYQTEHGKVIYLDKENGLEEMKKRTSYIKKGMKFEDNDNLGFICFSQLKLDRFGDIAAIEKLIEKHKPKLLIVDTYRRAISYDENDAGEVSKLFVDTLRPLVEKHNFSVLLIHHNRKSSNSHSNKPDEDSGIDEMDELRGSSDLANYADGILKLERKGNTFLILKQLKNRSGQEEMPMKIRINFIENSCSFKNDGEFIHQSISEKFAEMLIIWLTGNKKKHFTTKEAKDYAFKVGIKQRNYERGLANLSERGIIERTQKGEYDFKI